MTNALNSKQKSTLKSAMTIEARELIETLRQRGYDVALKDESDPTRDRPLPKKETLAEARDHLQPFIQHLHRGYQKLPFHTLLCSYLDDLVSGKIKRLIIECPPRHGKSLHSSVYLPAFFLGRNPDKMILHTSYGEDLLKQFSRQARGAVRSEEYAEIFPDIAIDPNSRAIESWDLAGPWKGGYKFAGQNGTLTGRGADLMIVDDPVSGDQDARSETALNNLWQWYVSTAYSRLEGQASIVIIMTRWSEDDLVGRILASSQASAWTVLRVPVLAEDDDPVGRAPGEALWPDKYDRDYLMDIRALDVRSFEAIYQQNPSPPEGNIFKTEWWKYRYDTLSQYRLVELHYDTAVKKGARNDWTAMWAGGLTFDNKVHVLDIWWDKLEFPALVQRVKDDYAAFVARGLRPTGIYIEDKASGSSLYQALAEETQLPVGAILPEGDKEARAIAVTPYYSSGKVLHPQSHPNLESYFLLMEKFPHTKIKDPVDASTQGVNHLMENALLVNVGISQAGGTRPNVLTPLQPIAPFQHMDPRVFLGRQDLRNDYRIR